MKLEIWNGTEGRWGTEEENLVLCVTACDFISCFIANCKGKIKSCLCFFQLPAIEIKELYSSLYHWFCNMHSLFTEKNKAHLCCVVRQRSFSFDAQMNPCYLYIFVLNLFFFKGCRKRCQASIRQSGQGCPKGSIWESRGWRRCGQNEVCGWHCSGWYNHPRSKAEENYHRNVA